jgi:hypothetical protein
MTNAPLPPLSSPVRSKTLYARLWLNSWRGRILWFFAGILMACLLVWTLVRMTPAWYAPLDPSDQTVIDLSGRAQNLISFELHTAVERVPLGEQRWSITQDEANSFLAILTAAPLDVDGNRQVPDDRVTDPFIAFGQGTVTIGARLRDLPGPTKQGGVGTLIFSVGVSEFAGKRMGHVKLIGARAGRLPVPVSVVESKLRGAMPSLVNAVERLVQVQMNAKDVSMVEDAMKRAGAGQPFPLEYRISKKDVVIKDLRFEPGKFTVVLGPQPRAATASAPATQPGAAAR